MSRTMSGLYLLNPLHMAVFASCVVATLVLGMCNPNEWLNMQEYGLFQNIQAGVLGLAFGLSLLTLFRSGGDERTFWIFFVAFAFFFFWRELDLDQEFFEDRMFSWAYLFRDSVPVKNKIILGVPSMTLALGWVGHLVWQAPTIMRTVWQRIHAATVLWGGLTLACFGLAQIWDKTTAFQRDWGIQIYDRATKDPYVEEAFELLGAVAFLLLILVLKNLPHEQTAGDCPNQSRPE